MHNIRFEGAKCFPRPKRYSSWVDFEFEIEVELSDEGEEEIEPEYIQGEDLVGDSDTEAEELARALDDKKYDVRLRDKLIADKKLAYSDVESYISNLSDDTTIATTTDEVANKSSNESSEENN